MTNECCKKKSKKSFEIDNVADFLKLISAKNRIRIICLLKQGERCVCDIQEQLELPQNLASHHLKVLSEAEIVDSRKDGLNVFYSLNEKKIKKYKNIINNFL
ncbi:MAG: ArsR/SmtB family transcription factor [Patescibacteria group bacterium]